MADLLIDFDAIDATRGQVVLATTGYVAGVALSGLGGGNDVSEATIGSATVAQAATDVRADCRLADQALTDSATAVSQALGAAIDALRATDTALAAGAQVAQ